MTTEAEFYLANPWRGNGMPGFDPAGVISMLMPRWHC